MRRASRSKRSANERETFSLMVHGPEYGAGEEVVINPECFPQLKVHDLVEVSQPDRGHQRLVLQVTSLVPVRGKLQVRASSCLEHNYTKMLMHVLADVWMCYAMQISLLKEIAAQFGFESLLPVTVVKVDPRDVTVDFIELTFKDQFLSRADIWRFKVSMLGKCMYVGKNVACLGIRSQVEGLLANNQDVYCGVIGADTKMIVRSRSSRLFWLVQMSAEMWEFAPDGELYYEKLLNRLLHVMIRKWNESSVSHSVTIIAFSRSFYDKSQFPDDYDPLNLPFSEPTRQGFGPGSTPSGTETANGYGPTVHVDPITGRYYEDFYKVLVMNYTGPDWNHLLGILKREFATYHETHRWRSPEEVIPAEYKIYQCTKGLRASDRPADDRPRGENHGDEEKWDDDGNTEENADERYVQWTTLPHGIPSRAMDGNILEAINVTLNILDKHYMDRDLNRTGQSIVMITAGCSIFNVDKRLAQITKQRMMDNGVGMDMISLTTPPMHVVPLFICQKPSAHDLSPRERYPIDDQSVRRQRKYSISSDHLNSLETCSLRGLERELSDFEQAHWRDEQENSLLNVDADGHPEDDMDDEGEARNHPEQRTFSIPHWVNITFLDFDCQCGGDFIARDRRHYPRQSPPASSPTHEGSSRSQYSNRLLSHRAQTCECQYYLNRRFLPLPPFRMFDVTAPGERLSFPVSLKNIIKGYPRNFKSGDSFATFSSDETLTADRNQRRQCLSDIGDAISSSSSILPINQIQISRSPDYEFAFSPHLKQFSSTLGTSILTREAFQEYDAEVCKLLTTRGEGRLLHKDMAISRIPRVLHLAVI
uniref:DEP domain-containing protein n=1 Tax=Globisporangium ultimum (strain ATCC 200006 / CBS 805.95 / DAOM BR144) TaxID=431595 RepID=K3X4M6_GLOUD